MKNSKRHEAIIESAIKGKVTDLKKLIEQELAQKVSKVVAEERKNVAENFLTRK